MRRAHWQLARAVAEFPSLPEDRPRAARSRVRLGIGDPTHVRASDRRLLDLAERAVQGREHFVGARESLGGSLARQRSMMAESATGASGFAERTDGAGRVTCATRIADARSPSNGKRPVSAR
jgi:hypothetical protein